jgi:hypothetical protein
MNNQSVILSKDITTGDITPLVSSNNVLLTSRPSLNQLTNVAITDPQDNQLLKYDSGGEFWYNATGGGGGATTLAELTDCDINTPTNGQYLQYDTSLAIPKWVNKTPSYLSYSVNAYPINANFSSNTNFSMFSTTTFNTSPTPVVNYNFSNGISLSTATGLITGLDATKSYMIDLTMMKTPLASANGAHIMTLLDNVGGNVIASSNIQSSSSSGASLSCFTMLLNTIITGQTQLYPVLRANIAGYTGRTDINGYNAVINIREL